MAFAIVPRTMRFVNKGSWWSGTRLARRCQRVWITGDRFRGGVEVWYCDAKWRVRYGGSAESLEHAKRQAERFYVNLADHWVDIPVSKTTPQRMPTSHA